MKAEMPVSIHRILWAVVALAVALCPADALGEASGTGEDQEAAREHNARAREHYNADRFEEALTDYTAAYELFSHPIFLFNLGQCHRGLGNHERAVHYFTSYLRERPNASNRDVVERLLTASQLEVAQDDGGPGPEAGDAGICTP